MRDPEIESAKQAIADDAGTDRGNDVTDDVADDKTADEDGTRKGETPSRNSVTDANAAGANPDKS
jgi:hypothetical protein